MALNFFYAHALVSLSYQLIVCLPQSACSGVWGRSFDIIGVGGF